MAEYLIWGRNPGIFVFQLALIAFSKKILTDESF
jgi:hypothetical protein